ncbi:MAG: LysM peptidoglycan-binding domain-containing protein [Opitutus sp.]|nr:LysM peptidoglycan-binding domain-containing protein [Opitutus sp.]
MDTISRENNSMLPIAAVIAGVLALLVGAYGAIKASSLQKIVAAQEEKIARVDAVESQVSSMQASVDKSARDISSLNRSTQDAFNTVAASLGNIQASITKLEEAAKRAPAPAAAAKKSGEPVVAGPGEYVIKAGDTGAKIARAQGFPLSDLQAVNPGIDWTKLHVGQKIKLPAK